MCAARAPASLPLCKPRPCHSCYGAFEYIIKPRSGLGDVDPAAVKRATLEWLRFTAIPDRHLQDRRRLVGSGLTIADLAATSILPYAGVPASPDEFHAANRWHDRLNERSAWREPFPALVEAA